MIRSFAAPLFVLIAVLFETCTVPIPWAVQPQATGPTAPPLPIPSGQAGPTAQLLSASLLVLAELPTGYERGFLNDASVTADDPFDFAARQGWMVRASTWRSTFDNDPASDYAIDDYRYAFADEANARAYVDAHQRAAPARANAEPIAEFAPDTYAFAGIDAVGGGYRNNARIVQVRSVVERVVISFIAMYPVDDEAWLSSARGLLETARQRTQQALAAIGE